MKAVTQLLNPLASFYNMLRTLGIRMLVLTIAAMALLYIAVLVAVNQAGSNVQQDLMGPPIVRQATAAAKLMDDLSPEGRKVALAALNSPMLHLSLTEDFSKTPPIENPSPVFVPVMSIYAAALADRPFSIYSRDDPRVGLWPRGRLTDDLIIVMRLTDGSGLVVESHQAFRRLVSLYGVAFVVGVIGLVLIGAMTWASLSYVGPLARLAQASKGLVDGVDTTDGLTRLPETGPKPVRDLAATLNLAGTKLAQLMAERTTTLAAIAHDLRTYLTRLRMRSEFIEDDDQREKTVRDIEDMARLVEDTLLFGKSVTKPPRAERLELTGWLEDFVARRTDVGEPVVFEKPTDPVKVDIATAELSRALNNLVDNALRYAGAATLSLDTSSNEAVAIEVLDQGPGVPDAFLERMSDPFTRLEQSRSRDTGGAGLGVAIAKALVEQVGGRLALANRIEGGFSARVMLPRVK